MTTQMQKTNQQQKPQSPSALGTMAARLNVDPNKLHAMLKATVFQKANDEELMALVMVANAYGLDPILKDIYAFPAKGGGIVPVVSVDGWNRLLIRQPDFDGIDFEFTDKDDGTPHSCTATVHIKNRAHPVRVTEYFDECKRNTEPWNNMPRRMLRNRTLCQASRMAFGISGVYNDDEGRDVIEVTSTVVPSEPPPKLVAAPPTVTAQAELEALVTAEGFTFDHLQKFGADSGNITDAASIGSFAEVPTDEAKRLLKAKKGLLEALKTIKGAQ
jgi:phage recombination protein Bet